MEKEFVPYEEALGLKELGFDEECITHYYDGEFEGSLDVENYPNKNTTLKSTHGEQISCPLYQQAFRWFMDNHQLYFRPNYPYYDHKDYAGYIHKVGEYSSLAEIVDCKSSSEAELMAIRKLIQIVKAL